MTLGTVDILQRLVAFPTVSREPNLPLIDWVRNFLAELNIESHLVRDASGLKSNLFATIGPPEEGGLVLSGHTDVVPVDGQVWSSDPFTLTLRGSRLYGRGACDMKGFIASALSRIPGWQRSSLRRPVHFMFSYDEEIGCLGAPSMIDAAQRLLPKPAAVLVGEPTGMRLATQHKGVCVLRTRVTGIEAHSSLIHQGVSAVMLAGEMISQLNEISLELAARKVFENRNFDPPHTTLSVNRIEGGTATNILAALCEFDWDIRALPGETPTAILVRLSLFADRRITDLSREGKRCSIETLVQADVPSLKADGGVAEELVRAVIAGNSEPVSVPFGTEGGQFARAGWSTVVCGPGSIQQAHKPDEYLERSDLMECEVFLDRAVARQCM
jgi:acetylornithine deacetylase